MCDHIVPCHTKARLIRKKDSELNIEAARNEFGIMQKFKTYVDAGSNLSRSNQGQLKNCFLDSTSLIWRKIFEISLALFDTGSGLHIIVYSHERKCISMSYEYILSYKAAYNPSPIILSC